MFALKNEKKELFNPLLKAKPDLTIVNNEGQDVMVVAIETGQDYAIVPLIKAGMSVEKVDENVCFNFYGVF